MPLRPMGRRAAGPSSPSRTTTSPRFSWVSGGPKGLGCQVPSRAPQGPPRLLYRSRDEALLIRYVTIRYTITGCKYRKREFTALFNDSSNHTCVPQQQHMCVISVLPLYLCGQPVTGRTQQRQDIQNSCLFANTGPIMIVSEYDYHNDCYNAYR